MLNDWQCENCQMTFDNQETYQRHKNKFCTNSKYADLDSLSKQFGSLMQGKDISIHGRPQLAQKGLKYNFNTSKIEDNLNIDREYRSLLKQIGDRQGLKKQLEREKISAEEQLMSLQKKQKEYVVDAKRQDLQEVLKRREALAKQQQQLQKQIRLFQKQRKQQSRVKTLQPDEDFVYREGREAGKIAMQRRLLEQKKRDIEANIKAKKRQQERVNRQLSNIQDQAIFVPDYRKKSNVAQSRSIPNQYQKSNVVQAPVSPPTPIIASLPKQSKKYKKQIPVQPERIAITRQNQLKQSASNRSNISSVVDALENQAFLHASRFAGNEKTLFQNINPKGKSDEDIFIESLTAQEYDALNLLARLPKESQIYQVKLRQYQQMSQVRQQLKDKIQKIRLQKVKKEFEHEKIITETEKGNLMWLDKNRKDMLNRQTNFIHDQHKREIQENQNNKNNQGYNFQQLPENSFGSNQQLGQSNQRLPSITQIPMRPTSTQEGAKGYKIAVKYVKGYQNKGPLCVKIVIQQQVDRGAMWAFMTKYHDQYAPKDDRNPFNPRAKNRLDEFGNVVFNQTFELREDLQALYNINQLQIYLWVLLMEKEEQKLSNQPQVYVWYCLKLTHFGQLKQGVFTLSLYHDNFPYPIPSDMNKMKSKATEEIVIEVSDTIFTTPAQELIPKQPQIPQKTNFSKVNTTKKTTSKKGKSIKIKQQGSSTQILQNIHEEFFMQNQDSSDFQVVNKDDPISFNFSVVGMRTLPSHTGPVRLQIAFINQNGQAVVNRSEILSQNSSDMYNPKISFTKQIRDQQMPASTVVQIKILALSTLNYEPGLLGFCYFHLFFNAQGEPEVGDRPSKYFLINGLYQIPIYWGNLSKYVTIQQLNDFYPKIPCSSVLLAVGPPSQQIERFPEYSQGKYNTTFFEIDVIQYRLFQEQSKRQVLDTRQYVKGYFKFKGVTSKSPSEQTKLLNQVLAFNSQNTSNLMNLNAMAEYNSSFGIVASIDLIRVSPSRDNYYYFCTLCLSPPANYYKQSGLDLDFIYQVDLASSFTQDIVFKDEPVVFSPKYSPNTSLIIEVNRIRLNSSGKPESSIEPCGCTVLPVFDLNVQVPCVNVGIHQINLEDGQFDSKDLRRMQTELINYVDQKLGSKKTEDKIIVRLLNGFFLKQIKTSKLGSKGQPLKKVFQSSAGFKTAAQGVQKIIEDNYGVSLK